MQKFVDGDRIRIKKETNSAVYEGVVMPTASTDIVIKLDSGYNIGIRPGNAEIEVIRSAERLKGERKAEIHRCGKTI